MNIEQAQQLLIAVRQQLARRLIGQTDMVDGLLMALIAGGHILIEGVPGLAKTLAIKSLAELAQLSFKRIQFTPDLLPADVTGTQIWEPNTGNFSVRQGPVFANIVLADEINRAPAKVQSALLEAMEEGQVSLGGESLGLPQPFFVLATQNPLDQEGTYALPEAELDRFLLKILVQYPKAQEELEISRLCADGSLGERKIQALLDASTIQELANLAQSIHCDPKVMEYLVNLVRATRPIATPDRGLYRYIRFGASPRASIALLKCARVQALFAGRDFVLPEDVKTIAPAVLRHRILLSWEAESDALDADAILAQLLDLVPVP